METYGNICLAIILGATAVFLVGAVIFAGFVAYHEIKQLIKGQ